ncbi:hypothetical protein [Saccharopolyspora rosea]|uniref:Secreted protein n=1 Tax=Saccharopolyspora rosea TaxID=524884 RepID=A0ABW3G1L1_9PSEU|nr:hypothetical protein [Saccharopolyspora rosea]
MGKSQFPFPMPKAGSGLLSKVLGGLVLLAVLALVVKHPTDAAEFARNASTALAGAVDGLTTFLRGVLD